MTLPWYPRDMGRYARDTKQLTMQEHGAYNLLLDHYYSTGPLPAVKQCSSNAPSNAELMPDHSRLYRICNAATKAEQEAVDFVIWEYFYRDGDFYRHKRCDQIIEDQMKKHENRVRAGSKAKLKQCSSNAGSKAPQKETKKKINNPPTPQRGTGFKKIGEGKGFPDFRIEDFLTDEDLDLAKESAPGWDIKFLMREYDQGVRIGDRTPPLAPGKAFAGWCKSYTKGKAP